VRLAQAVQVRHNKDSRSVGGAVSVPPWLKRSIVYVMLRRGEAWRSEPAAGADVRDEVHA